MLIGKDLVPLSEAVVTALKSLPGQSGNLSQLWKAISSLDKDAAAAILTHDLQAAVRQAVEQGAVTVQFDKKRLVDVITVA